MKIHNCIYAYFVFPPFAKVHRCRVWHLGVTFEQRGFSWREKLHCPDVQGILQEKVYAAFNIRKEQFLKAKIISDVIKLKMWNILSLSSKFRTKMSGPRWQLDDSCDRGVKQKPVLCMSIYKVESTVSKWNQGGNIEYFIQ